MKIVCISDTHKREPELPSGDVLIHSGDWSSFGYDTDTNKFIDWMSRIRFKYKRIVIVPGNHDKYIQSDTAKARQEFEDANLDLLIDEEVTIDGLKFYGSPQQPIFGRWAFGADDAKRKLAFDAVPDDTNVLITHCPPRGYLDVLSIHNMDPLGNAGCEYLRDAVLRVRPLLHVFGHIHEANGVALLGHTLLVNASHVDEDYNPTNGFTVVRL